MAEFEFKIGADASQALNELGKIEKKLIDINSKSSSSRAEKNFAQSVLGNINELKQYQSQIANLNKEISNFNRATAVKSAFQNAAADYKKQFASVAELQNQIKKVIPLYDELSKRAGKKITSVFDVDFSNAEQSINHYKKALRSIDTTIESTKKSFTVGDQSFDSKGIVTEFDILGKKIEIQKNKLLEIGKEYNDAKEALVEEQGKYNKQLSSVKILVPGANSTESIRALIDAENETLEKLKDKREKLQQELEYVSKVKPLEITNDFVEYTPSKAATISGSLKGGKGSVRTHYDVDEKAHTGHGTYIEDIGTQADDSKSKIEELKNEIASLNKEISSSQDTKNFLENRIGNIEQAESDVKTLEGMIADLDNKSVAAGVSLYDLEQKQSAFAPFVEEAKQLASVDVSSLLGDKADYESIISALQSSMDATRAFIEENKEAFGNYSLDQLIGQLDIYKSAMQDAKEAMDAIKANPEGTANAELDNLISKYNTLGEEARETYQQIIDSADKAGITQKIKAEETAQAEKNAAETAKYVQKTAYDSAVSILQGKVAAQKQAEAEEKASLKASEQAHREHAASIRSSASSIKSTINSISKVVHGLSSIGRTLGNILKSAFDGVKSALGSIGNKIKEKAEHFRSLFKATDKVSKAVNGFVNVIKRKLIRELASKVIQEAKNDLQAFAAQSAQTNANLSALGASFKTLGASIVSAFSPVLNAVAPILTKLVGYITTAVNAIGMFFAKLSGASSYKKAVVSGYQFAGAMDSAAGGAGKAAKATEDATEAAEEYQRTIMGFDELNVLDSQDDSSSSGSGGSGGGSGGGGGGGAPSGGDITWVDVPIDKEIGDFADKIKELFSEGNYKAIGDIIGDWFYDLSDYLNEKVRPIAIAVGRTLADIVNQLVDSNMLEGAGYLLGTSLSTALDGIYEFLNNTDFEALGADISRGLQELFSAIEEDGGAGDGWTKVGTTIGLAFNSVSDQLKGFALETPWEQWATYASNGINGLLDTQALSKRIEAYKETFNGLVRFLGTLNQQIDWTALKDEFSRSLEMIFQFDIEGAIVNVGEFITNFVHSLAEAVREHTADFEEFGKSVGEALGKINWSQILSDLWDIITKGIIPLIQGFLSTDAGGLIGAIVGGINALKVAPSILSAVKLGVEFWSTHALTSAASALTTGTAVTEATAAATSAGSGMATSFGSGMATALSSALAPALSGIGVFGGLVVAALIDKQNAINEFVGGIRETISQNLQEIEVIRANLYNQIAGFKSNEISADIKVDDYATAIQTGDLETARQCVIDILALYPQLQSYVDKDSGLFTASADAVKGYIRELTNLQIMDAVKEAMKEAQESLVQSQIAYNDAITKLAAGAEFKNLLDKRVELLRNMATEVANIAAAQAQLKMNPEDVLAKQQVEEATLAWNGYKEELIGVNSEINKSPEYMKNARVSSEDLEGDFYNLNDAVNAFSVGTQMANDSADKAAASAELYGEEMEDLQKAVDDTKGPLKESKKAYEDVKNAADLCTKDVGELSEEFRKNATTLNQNEQSVIKARDNIENAGLAAGIAGPKVQELTDKFSEYVAGGKTIQEATDLVCDDFDNLSSTSEDTGEKVKGALVGIIQGSEDLKASGDDVASNIEQNKQDIVNSLDGVGTTVGETASNVEQSTTTISEGFDDAGESAQSNSDLVTSSAELMQSGLEILANHGFNDLNSAMEYLKTLSYDDATALEIATQYIDSLGTQSETSSGDVESVGEAFQTTQETIASTIPSFATSIEGLTGYVKNLRDEGYLSEEQYSQLCQVVEDTKQFTNAEDAWAYLQSALQDVDEQNDITRENYQHLIDFMEGASEQFANATSNGYSRAKEEGKSYKQYCEDQILEQKTYYENLTTLAEAGIDGALIQTWMEGGTQYKDVVESLLTEVDGLSAEEIAELNETLKGGSNEALQGLIDMLVEKNPEMYEVFKDLMDSAESGAAENPPDGVTDTTQGVVDETVKVVKDGQPEMAEASEDLGDTATENYNPDLTTATTEQKDAAVQTVVDAQPEANQASTDLAESMNSGLEDTLDLETPGQEGVDDLVDTVGSQQNQNSMTNDGTTLGDALMTELDATLKDPNTLVQIADFVLQLSTKIKTYGETFLPTTGKNLAMCLINGGENGSGLGITGALTSETNMSLVQTALDNGLKAKFEAVDYSGIGESIGSGFTQGISNGIQGLSSGSGTKVSGPMSHYMMSLMSSSSSGVLSSALESIRDSVESLDLTSEGRDIGRNFAEAIASGIRSVHIPVPTLVSSGGHYVNMGKSYEWIPEYAVQYYANGGFPNVGQLFFARESGPEMIGMMGNQSAVANNEQIVEGITRGVQMGVASVFSRYMGNMNNGNNGDIVLVVDSEEIARAAMKGMRAIDKRVNPVMQAW